MTRSPSSSPKRFVVSPSERERLTAAREYVAKLEPDERAYLYRKPYIAAGGANQFSELYTVFNAVQVLGLAPGNTVLEVGSGPGWVTELLVLLDVNVTCIEPAADMVAIARERIDATFAHHRIAKRPRVEFLQSSLEQAELPEQSFDAVLFHESLHHIVDERVCIGQAFRALKPGGRMVVCEWCWIPGNAVLEASLQEQMERFGTLESPFTQQYLESLLLDTGFEEITRYHSINGFVPAAHGHRSVESAAEAPADRTNNLTAVRPYGMPTSRERNAVDPKRVSVELVKVEWKPGGNVVDVHIRVRNDSDAVLITTGIGRITVSLCAGRVGKRGFVEAGRVSLPSVLRPGMSADFVAAYALPAGAAADAWRLELVAEDVQWLDLSSKPSISRT